MQAWRLQQETLWFCRAGESHPQLIAIFVLRRDWLVIPVVNSPPLCFAFSMGMDGRRGGADESCHTGCGSVVRSARVARSGSC